MMKTPTKFGRTVVVLSVVFFLLSSYKSDFIADWGFFGHRKINRLAVFTLPPPLGSFYKRHIDFVTEHAVDPDKRRYAAKHEAVRHYFDIDHWGSWPFENLPRDLDLAVLKYGDILLLLNSGDTIQLNKTDKIPDGSDHNFSNLDEYVLFEKLEMAYQVYLKPMYYEDKIFVQGSNLKHFFKDAPFHRIEELIFVDNFSSYGILPYFLESYYHQLVEAFRQKNVDRILRISTEIGHYIGDASVPLHATENYNGQLTNQIGIHAFWESRIPELFADSDFDPIISKARYLVDPKTYFWNLVLQSHQLSHDVLRLEKQLSKSYPRDQQYCHVERLERTIRTQCEGYAQEYRRSMNGMVEDRWRLAIASIGNVWYSAWLDAGSPSLESSELVLSDDEKKFQQELNKAYFHGRAKGRIHKAY